MLNYFLKKNQEFLKGLKIIGGAYKKIKLTYKNTILS